MKRRGVLLTLGTVAAFGLLASACGQAASGEPPLPTYRYRLTVEVETPQGMRTGFSVIEVATHVASKNAFPDPGKLTTRVCGEAVAVDLPGGKTLFALLTRPGAPSGAEAYALSAFPPVTADEHGSTVHAELKSLLEQRGVGKIPPKYYPMLVFFADINDPNSVTMVDPGNMSAHFGKGFKLRQIAVQVTQEARTSGIRARLSWLSKFPEPALVEPHDSYAGTPISVLRHGSFVEGD